MCPILSLYFIISSLYYPYPLLFSLSLSSLELSSILIILNIRQVVLDGRAAAGIEPEFFFPSTFWRARAPNKTPSTRQKVETGTIPDKIHFGRYSRTFIGSRSKSPSNLDKLNSSKKPKIPGILAKVGQKPKMHFLFRPGSCSHLRVLGVQKHF